MRPKAWARLGTILLALLVVGTEPAVAGVFSVTPVRIYMTPRDRAVAVTITNEGDTPVVLQADLNQWVQKPDGTDELTPTEDLILSPPIIKLGPKARQVVRLARLVPPDAVRQLTYRMILREVPEATPAKDNIQVAIALALSLPVFITPPAAKRQAACKPVAADPGNLNLACSNTGTAYMQIREILVREDERLVGRFEGGPYILPGAQKVLPIKLERPGAGPLGALQLAVTFDDGNTQNFAIAAEAPPPGR
jgi:fimbrial chaperone protein